MKIYESAEDYLERILILTKQHQKVRSIDIANDMNLTKQSVHRAIKNFLEDGYINIDSDFYITLTEKGLAIAKNTYERHVVLAKYFMSLGVEESIAYRDACKVEHDLSDETFQAIKALLK